MFSSAQMTFLVPRHLNGTNPSTLPDRLLLQLARSQSHHRHTVHTTECYSDTFWQLYKTEKWSEWPGRWSRRAMISREECRRMPCSVLMEACVVVCIVGGWLGGS